MSLEEWFLENQRDFPWRKERSPYRVWISEVMLQQTRASVVIPYFNRWMDHFPDVKALYNASIEEVIKLWEGLGYYSRARNIHRAAKEIVERFGGEIPSSYEELISIRGFGPYTVGAILSFGFKKRAPAVDGNVARVLSRYFCIEEEITKVSVRKKIEELAESLLDKKSPWITAEALIELGATLCGKKPLCGSCPLFSSCRGRSCGKAEFLPLKKRAPQTTELLRTVFLIEVSSCFLVKKQEEGKVMGGLYEFPYVEGRLEMDLAKKVVKGWGGKSVCFVSRLRDVSHTFTRYKARLSPFLFQCDPFFPLEGYEWVKKKELDALPFSSGHRILKNFLQQDNVV